MKTVRWTAVLAVILLAIPVVGRAAEGQLPFDVVNRLRLEWDDNIRQVEHNPDSSFKVIEELQFSVDLNLEQTFVSLRYRPSFVWWDNRPEDKRDFHHAFDLVLNHKFSPRFSLSMKDTFRIAELPELIEDGAVVRENNDYKYNSIDGTFSTVVRPNTRLDLSGRYVLLRYDDDDVADREDYDQYIVGLSLQHAIVPETMVAGDVRYQTIDYDSALNRDSDSTQVGGMLQQEFSPNLLGNLRAGYEYKDLDQSNQSSDESPYGEASLTYLPTPLTRITGGAGYSLYETDVYPFSSQTRTRIFGNIAHDLTAKISLYLSGVYTHGKYDGDDLPEGAKLGDLPAKVVQDLVPNATQAQLDTPLSQSFIDSLSDKSEDIYQVSARITYKVNRANWLEASWQYSKLDSDLREDFERNRVSVGWKSQL